MASGELNNLLAKIDRNNQNENFENKSGNSIQSNDEKTNNNVVILNESPTKNSNFLTKIKANSLRNKKELEAAEVIYDTQLEKLKHQATASTRESQAFWDAKSVEIAESIKTYVQTTLNDLENQRLTSKNDAIHNAFIQVSEKMTAINADSSLPDIFKEELVSELRDNLKITVDRLKNNAIAQKYNLS